MELMQLEMLVAAVEEGSIQAAAERVFRTQPAVSIALRKLEEEIGAAIFDRANRRHYALTDAGKLLYEQAKQMLALRDGMIRSVNELQHLQRGDLRIGAGERIAQFVLPALTAEFSAEHPSISIEIIRQPSNRLPKLLRMRRLDLAILAFKPDADEFEAFSIAGDPLVLVVHPSHRLAKQPAVTLGDLEGEKFIAHKTESPARQSVIEAFRRHHVSLNVIKEISAIARIKEMAAHQQGLSLLPLTAVRDEVSRGEIAAIPVSDFEQERSIWLARLKDSAYSTATGIFLNFIAASAGHRAKCG
jgi:DNA-binding transcriptional LysR family regulator